MKKQLHLISMLMLAFIGLSNNVKAQTPNWAWANDTAIAVGGMTTDAAGNVYVANDFSPKFLVKYNNNGGEVWQKSAIGSCDSPPAIQTYPNSIALDPSGNILVSGFFTSDTMILGSTIFLRSSTVDMFVAKFDNNGNFIWGKTEAIGNVGNTGFKVSSDASGNVIVVGSYSAASVTIGSTTLTNPCTSGGGCPSMLVVKYDASGTVQWAKSSFAGIGTSYAYSVAVDAASNIYVGGDFLGNRNGIVKYNTIGDTVWTQPDGGWYLSIDGSGNLYSGYDKDVSDGRVKRFNSTTGALVWGSSTTGNTSNKGNKLMTDGAGNVYYVGTFRSTSITFGSVTLPHAGTGSDDDIFIAKFDNSGTVVWAAALGNTGYDAIAGVTTDVAGNVFIGGIFFSPTLSFDAISLINTGQIAGVANIFFAKLGNNVIITNVANITTNGDFSFYPNPATNEVVVETADFKNTTLEILSLNGQLIQSISLQDSRTVVQTSMLPAGMYLLKVKGAEHVSVQKLIKQ